jgi:hypothetical protein
MGAHTIENEKILWVMSLICNHPQVIYVDPPELAGEKNSNTNTQKPAI